MNPDEYLTFPEAKVSFTFEREKGKLIHLQNMWLLYPSDLRRLKRSQETISVDLLNQIKSEGSKKDDRKWDLDAYYDKLTISIPYNFPHQMVYLGVFVCRINNKFYVGEFKFIVKKKKNKRNKCPDIKGPCTEAPNKDGTEVKQQPRPLPYRNIINKQILYEAVDESIKIEEPLTFENYPFILTEALKMEFADQEDDLRTYNQAKARLEKRNKGRYALFVENLVEKRPSVVIGDVIKVRPVLAKRREDNFYGRVVAVEKQHVVFVIHSSFHPQHKPAIS